MFYLDNLNEACLQHNCALHAYVMMNNHVHLLITPNSEHGISKVMQSLGRRYVQYFNKHYHRTGTLWEGRFRATVIDTERYLLTCYRYIELNPVRASMVKLPSEHKWSSHGYNALGLPNDLITPHPVYLALGKNLSTRLLNYQSLFGYPISEPELEEIRTTT